MSKEIKVLVIDDSALIRKLLSEILETDPDISVIGTAQDPYIARDKIKKLKPDVLTLDIEMPRMDGITFLRNLMRLHPMPVVMVSSLTQAQADITFQALEIGAVDFISKPTFDVSHQMQSYSSELISKIKTAATAKISPYKATAVQNVKKKYDADVIIPKLTHTHFTTTEAIIAIGASTGGTEAVAEILTQLPANAPGIVITQHIPASFSAAFANRINNKSALSVCEASERQTILPGHAYVAPGDRHLLVESNGARYQCKLCDGPPVNRHKPSVDVLFRSAAQSAGPNSVGILLTGMGADGAQGLKELQQTGAETIVQDENSSVVWGMPGSAVKLGAANQVLPLEAIAQQILTLTHHEKRFGT